MARNGGDGAMKRGLLTPMRRLHMVSRHLGRARSSAVEHLTFNQRVDGSIPSGLTKILVGDKLIRVLKDIPGAGSISHPI